MKVLKEKKGITLIALVITIIVLLILAAVTLSLVLGDNGVVTKANQSKEATMVEDEKEKIGLAYLDYKTKRENDENAVLAVEGALVDEDEEDSWEITFTATNNKYILYPDGTISDPMNANVPRSGPWVQTGDNITDGKVTVKIGDYVNYTPGGEYTWETDTSKGVGQYYSNGQLVSGTLTTMDTDWRVLGVNENGNLELVSEYGLNNLGINGEQGYLNGVDQLNDACNTLYGRGKGADSVRSLNYDDVFKLIGVTKEEFEQYQQFDLYKYRFPEGGTQIQYSISEDNGETWSEWYNQGSSNRTTSFKAPGGEEINSNNPIESSIFKSDEFNERASDYTSGTREDLLCDPLEWIGSVINGKSYWLASTMTDCYDGYCNFCIGYATSNGGRNNFEFTGMEIYSTRGSFYRKYSSNYSGAYIRPVVTLKSNTKLTGNSNDGWEIQ